MKTHLIKLPKYNIIVSDENIQPEDFWVYICPINGLDFGDDKPIIKNNLPSSWFNKLHDKDNYKKVMASENIEHSLPSIDYNDFNIKDSFSLKNVIYLIDNVSDNWHKCYTEEDKINHIKKLRLPEIFDIEVETETLWLNQRFSGTWQPFPDEKATEKKKVPKIVNNKIKIINYDNTIRQQLDNSI